MRIPKGSLLCAAALSVLVGGCAAITDQSADEAFDQQKYDIARREYVKLSKDGDAYADRRLGYMHEQGVGTNGVNMRSAVRWYRLGAERGDVICEAALGNIYEWYAADYIAALQWDTKAAQAGNSLAAANLAALYEHGLGVTQDHSKAQTWQQVADQQPWGSLKMFASAATAAISIHMHYDKQTMPSGATGAAQVGFDYDGAGQASNVRITRSSGDKALDALALQTVSTAVLPPLPPEAVKAKISHFLIGIDFVQISQYRPGVIFWPG